jgi:hypothetical protein
MRLPRMTTRRWMVVVAVVAMALGGYFYAVTLKRSRDNYLEMARLYSGFEAYAREILARGELPYLHIEREDGRHSPEDQRDFREAMLREIDHYAALARKYERAARYPWLPVEPDLPEP